MNWKKTPEFGATIARCLNQSHVSAVLQSNLIAIKFGTPDARRLNWALNRLILVIDYVRASKSQLITQIDFSKENQWWDLQRQALKLVRVRGEIGQNPIKAKTMYKD